MRLGPTTVKHIVRNPDGTDRYGSRLAVEPPPVDIPHCRFDITTSEEFEEDRQTVVSRGNLYAPPTLTVGDAQVDLVIKPEDAFEIHGVVWEVAGNPRMKDSHLGPHHYETRLIHYHH